MGIRSVKRLLPLAYSVSGRKLAFEAIPIFATDRCNSECRICGIWGKKPKTDLELEIFERILSDRVIARITWFILTGGEFILHPKYEEILSLFNDRQKHYILLSNGLLVDRLVKAVREFEVKHLSLSLDGSPETYRRIRGVDGYSCVEKVLEELKEDDVRVEIGYTVSPWNTREDLLHVIGFCQKHRVSLSVGYYCNIEYYDVTKPAERLYNVDDIINQSYHRLYPLWASRDLRMPCLSIFVRPVIRPNGDVELCEPRQIKLGNLHEKGLGEIWRSKRTRRLQQENIRCAACWHDAQRLCDISVIAATKLLLPPALMNRVLSGYDWEKIYKSIY
jgi:MoaA/NifB/PqqE/SkfB family radical SAM enzyme